MKIYIQIRMNTAMRTFALIGAILVLLLPFSVYWITLDSQLGKTTIRGGDGLLYYNTHTEVGSSTHDETKSFGGKWLDKNGVYAGYFSTSNDDAARYVGLIVIVLLIAAIALAVARPSNAAAIVLIVCGILLLIMRFRKLDDANTSFYDKSSTFGITTTYIEIPLGFILALIFGLVDLKKGDR